MYAIINGRLIIGDKIQNRVLVIAEKKIQDITDSVPCGMETLDAQGCYIAPGFINLHIHGLKGNDIMDGSFNAMNYISKELAKSGVTTFLATTSNDSRERTKQAIKEIGNSMVRVEGAKIAGIHMEGPFISREFKGAQNEEYILNPTIENFMDLCNNNESIVKIVTLAPEIDGAYKLIHYLKQKEIVVSIGHTGASYEQAMRSMTEGVSHATHTYNAMKGLHHRQPGTVGAIFNSTVTAEFIADGIHVDYAALKILVKQKGVDKVIAVTDSIGPSGFDDGEYFSDGSKVYIKGNQVRFADGTLVGSTLEMNNAIYNLVNYVGIKLTDAVKMATTNPAKVIGLTDAGEIKPGNIADIVLFDQDIKIHSTFVSGRKVYSS